MFRNETFEGRVPYCTGATPGSGETSMYNTYFLFILDVVNIALDFVLLKYNKYKMKYEKNYKLCKTFQRQQNVYSIEQFLPSALFHAVCYVVQLASMVFGRSFRGKVSDIEFNTINAYTYLMPYYCAIGPTILLILMKKGRLVRKENLKNTVVPQTAETN
ncbi:hypothetical protein PFISCL1PPCAC_3589, partial [Pristionchus fissidentatus]